MQRKSVKRHRRRFLKQAGVIAGTGVFMAMFPGRMPPAEAKEGATRSRQGLGYRLTPHIRTYYEKAGE